MNLDERNEKKDLTELISEAAEARDKFREEYEGHYLFKVLEKTWQDMIKMYAEREDADLAKANLLAHMLDEELVNSETESEKKEEEIHDCETCVANSYCPSFVKSYFMDKNKKTDEKIEPKEEKMTTTEDYNITHFLKNSGNDVMLLGSKGSDLAALYNKINIDFPSVRMINNPAYITALHTIEAAGRTCYKSKMSTSSKETEEFIRKRIATGHESILEHISITFEITCDRGVSHELVRHRLASYSQESTRYCNYSKDKFGNAITLIFPSELDVDSKEAFEQGKLWLHAMELSADTYFKMLEAGAKPELARSVLPNSLKTTVVTTMNIREWRHFLKLRCDSHAHPDMRVIANQIKRILKDTYHVFFEDIK